MKLIAQVIIALVVATPFCVSGSSIYRSFSEELPGKNQAVPTEDFDDEPVYEPRFFGWFAGGQTEVQKDKENNVTAALSQFLSNSSLDTLLELLGSKNGSLQDSLLKITTETSKGNETLGKLASLLKNSSYDTLQEGLLNFTLSTSGANEMVARIAGLTRNSGNKTLKESVMNLVSNLTLSELEENETVKSIIEALGIPGNNSLQENFLGLASDAVFKKLGNNTTITNLVNVTKNFNSNNLQETFLNMASNANLSQFEISKELITILTNVLENSEDKTLQETLFDTALGQFGDNKEVIESLANIFMSSENKTNEEVLLNAALSQFGDNEMIKSIATALKNPGNKTLQENILSFAGDLASQFGDNDAVKSIVTALKSSDNTTLQENLLNVATEAALSKYGDNEAVKEIVGLLKNTGNKTVQENILSFATNAAKSKFANNAIIQSMVKVLEGNGTIQEKLSAATETALNSALGPVGAAVAKQGINMVGNVLKVGGGWFGGFLSSIGGNSTLGKIGQAIAGGSNVVGGFMNSVAGNKVAIATVRNPIMGLNTSTEHTTKLTNTSVIDAELKTNSVSELSSSEIIGSQIPVSQTKDIGKTVASAADNQNDKDNLTSTDFTKENKTGKTIEYKSEYNDKETNSAKALAANALIKETNYKVKMAYQNISENEIGQTVGTTGSIGGEPDMSKVFPQKVFEVNDEGTKVAEDLSRNYTPTFLEQGQLGVEANSSSNSRSNSVESSTQQAYETGSTGNSLQVEGGPKPKSALETALESLRAAEESLRQTYGSTDYYGKNNNLDDRASRGGDQASSNEYGSSLASVKSIEITTVKIQMG